MSSIDFDKDGEFFAVAGAGVTKKIKVCCSRSSEICCDVLLCRCLSLTVLCHFPVHDMDCTAKLRFSDQPPHLICIARVCVLY